MKHFFAQKEISSTFAVLKNGSLAQLVQSIPLKAEGSDERVEHFFGSLAQLVQSIPLKAEESDERVEHFLGA